MKKPVATPLRISEQFGFLWRLLPVLLLGVSLLLVKVWKEVALGDLGRQVFTMRRELAVLEARHMQLDTEYRELASFARIEREAREHLGMYHGATAGDITLRADLLEAGSAVLRSGTELQGARACQR